MFSFIFSILWILIAPVLIVVIYAGMFSTFFTYRGYDYRELDPIPWPKVLSIPNMRDKLIEKGYSEVNAYILVYTFSILVIIPVLLIYTSLITILVTIVSSIWLLILSSFYILRVSKNVLKLSCWTYGLPNTIYFKSNS